MELEALLQDLTRLEDGGWSDRLLQARLRQPGWDDARRARHTALWRLCLEGAPRHQAILAPRLRRRPRPHLRAALRLGLTLLEDGHAPHAVLDSLLRAMSGSPAAERGLVNAVLRGWLRDGSPIPEPAAALPPLLLELLPRLGEDPSPRQVEALWDSWRSARRLWLRVNVAAWSPQEALEELTRLGLAPEAAPEDSRFISPGELPAGGLNALAPLHDGRLHVQDLSVLGALRLLDPPPGCRLLDLCAAPGGKAMALLEADPSLDLTLVELHPGRARALERRLAGRGRLLRMDARDLHEDGWERILLDAPCSGSGTAAHRPEILARGDGAGEDLLASQRQLLAHAVRLLAPGGRLVYSTCSLDPRENGGQLRDLLETRDDLLVRTDLVPEDRRDADGGWLWIPWPRATRRPAGRPGAGGAWAVAVEKRRAS
jgi:16S rRNA (cytosine967-C5)-methyltransferase